MATYDAFISYSHAKDKPIAMALQSAIQTLGKPWYRRRMLRVFRDDASLSATPHLWSSIEQALSQSRYLILLASPEAATSTWVAQELLYWLDHKKVDTLLLAVTEGELVWNYNDGDFSWTDWTPLPDVLTGRFAAEPRWVDLRQHRSSATTKNSSFIELAADFAATIRGIPKDDLLSQEVRQQRRALRLAWGAIGSLFALTSVAGWQWKVALDAERDAIEQKEFAEQQQQLAGQEQRGAFQQRDMAAREQERAQKALTTATRTTTGLISDLSEFRDRAGASPDLLRKILDRLQELQQQLAEFSEGSPVLRESAAVSLTQIAILRVELKDTKTALAVAERVRQIYVELVSADPANRQLQGNLAESHLFVGLMLATIGRRDEALLETRKALPMLEKAAAADAGNAEWQSRLANAQYAIGGVLMEAGRHDEALAECRKGLLILEKLAAADPGDANRQSELATSYNLLGGALAKTGRRDEALGEYRKGLIIREKLVAADPGNAVRQRELALIHGTLANTVDRPRAHLAHALEIFRKLETENKLSAGDKDLINSIERRLAALPPEQAEAR